MSTWDLFWRCTVRITFTGETCLWASWLWLSFLWPSWLWLSWFWVKSLSFSSLGGGDAPPFSPPPPPWHHFLGSNVDLRQKNCSCQVLLGWIVKRRVHLCTGPIHSWTRLLNSSAWEEIWVLEIFASDCRRMSWWQLFWGGDLSFRNICIWLEDCHDDNYFRHLPLSAMEELHKETLPPVQKDFNSSLSLINDS